MTIIHKTSAAERRIIRANNLPIKGKKLAMTKQQLARYREVIRELSRLSHDGWRDADQDYYMQLQTEYRQLVQLGYHD